MKLYKVRFYRFNTATNPMLEQKSDVVFRTAFKKWSDEFERIMWEAMWSQNPSWLTSHGSRFIGFRGWSSVMYNKDSLEEVKLVDVNNIDDLTGEGNMIVAFTFHPLLPDDIRRYLTKAYERGVKDANKTTT